MKTISTFLESIVNNETDMNVFAGMLAETWKEEQRKKGLPCTQTDFDSWVNTRLSASLKDAFRESEGDDHV